MVWSNSRANQGWHKQRVQESDDTREMEGKGTVVNCNPSVESVVFNRIVKFDRPVEGLLLISSTNAFSSINRKGKR